MWTFPKRGDSPRAACAVPPDAGRALRPTDAPSLDRGGRPRPCDGWRRPAHARLRCEPREFRPRPSEIPPRDDAREDWDIRRSRTTRELARITMGSGARVA